MLVELQHYRFVGQFILPGTGSGKMFDQMPRHRLNSADHAVFVVGLFKGGFHRAANLFPFLRTHFRVNPAIGNNLDIPISKQQTNQHAVILFGVPYTQLRKHVDRTLPRGQAP